ncbi:dicarboxylate:amino acid:cation symporter DAACS family protein [Oceanobacillus oncorhynchi subsp. incaldanensis]|uniref:dicarboxylate/amino acid:cation symporter n=1 Tax=Oceanobacillus oncorhynchi TaxID=545501 RepID=UPI001B209757|nr:dicarboxylate/amino acid:cation symporter [Oceanobacillus oncorhynchi]GIO21120.1 dicarboxylate:amino acid:cation symporter DAACS family protein [Oceanobacillus oncorhynchi subsp. incaldanensis]
MKNLLTAKKHLFTRIAIGFGLGILFGILLPEFSIQAKFVGDIYLNLIQMMIIPIIFVAVSTGIINIGSSSDLGRIGFKSIVVFVAMFITTAAISLVISYLIRPGQRINMDAGSGYDGEITEPSVADFFMNIVPSNLFQAISEGDIFATILFTVIFSVAIVIIGKEADPVKTFINSLSKVIFKILDFIMELTPIGIIFLMAYAIAEYGAGIFSALGLYIFTAYFACIIVFILVMLIPVWLYTKFNQIDFIKGIYKVWLVSLSTTSSAVTMPTTMRVTRNDFKVSESITNFVVPLGTTINMAGGAVSFSLLAVFVSDFYDIPLGVGQIIYLVMIATILNMAAPGIPGGGIVLGASFLTLLNLPIELMGPIAAIYRLLDMAYTTMNITGDATAAVLIDKSEEKRNVKLKARKS